MNFSPLKILGSLGLLAAAAGGLGATLPEPAEVAAYRSRVHEVLAWQTASIDPRDVTKGGLAEVAAKLALRQDADWCSRRVIQLMAAPSGDMFWMFPCTTVAYLGRDQLSAEARSAIREAWRRYMPQRGDTENHWVMYYACLYLMASLYPDEPAERWYSGKSSTENREEAEGFIRHWVDLTTTIGQGEYDPTHYIGEYAIPMLMLATWSSDPAMRRLGQMMLEYLMADFAADTLDGLYVGAHSRASDRDVMEKWHNLYAFFSWLFFHNVPPPPSYGGWGIYFAANAHASPFLLPEVIRRIATERSGPYLEREVKRTRHRWRGSDVRNLPVYKQTYITGDYAVGSSQGGWLQPIQQHTWDVTWSVPDPRGVHNTLFTINPHYSSEELQMYFTEHPDWMPEAVTRQGKPTYMSEDKLLGGSPYEQVFQHDDALIALYYTAAGATFEHINGFFSKDLTKREEDASGWIFVQGGRAYIAYYPLAPYEWRPIAGGGERLYSAQRSNGCVVQVAAEKEFASWEAFKAAVRGLPLETSTRGKPRVRFTSLRGRVLEFAYDEIPIVDGARVEYDRWKLFEGPYLNAELHSRKLVLSHGKLRRILDFNTLTTVDTVEPAGRP
jgi:hypothetical protein